MTLPSRIGEYRVRFDHTYYAAAMAGLRPFRHAFRFVGYAFLALAVGLFLLMSAIAIADGEWWKVGFAGLPFVGFFAYLKLRAPKGIEKLRTVVGYRAEMEIVVAPAGIELVGPAASTTLRWTVFERADFRAVGVLLVHADGTAVWLPDSARVSGTRESVEQVVSGQVASIRRSR